MEICAKCHEKDADAIGCKRSIDKHHLIGFFECRICGETKKVYMCHKYHNNGPKQLKTW